MFSYLKDLSWPNRAYSPFLVAVKNMLLEVVIVLGNKLINVVIV
jgi:hypothetical protein